MAEANKKRTILLAVDGSKHSEDACEFYMEHLHKDGDFVVVLTVPETPQLPVAPYPYGNDYYEEWMAGVKRVDDACKDLLKAYGIKLKHKFHESSTKLIKEPGNAGEVICKNAQEEGADLIVLGCRGLGVVRRTLLGSVSNYVVHHAHVPVNVVPKKKEHHQ